MEKKYFLFAILLFANTQFAFAKTEFKGSKTEANIVKAFAGESMARNKYSIFSQVAEKEGNKEAENLFLTTAKQEATHAKVLLEMIKSDKIKTSDEITLGKIGNTQENLKTAFDGETAEYTNMYAGFEKTAKEEGFNDIAEKFKNIAISEKNHADSYQKLMLNQKNMAKTEMTDANNIYWVCTECGYVHKGPQAPEKCPVCGLGSSYFVKTNKKA